MVRLAVQKKGNEAGQAVLVVVAAISVFLLGAVGLAVDGSHLYAQRQAAQAAADASAVAGIMSIFDGTNTGTNAFGSSAYYCGSSDTTTPCIYATKNGFNGAVSSGSCTSSADCVYVEPDPTGVTVSNLDAGTPNLLRVTVTRPVSMTLTKLVGLSSFNVSASATAAIVDVMSPVPILVTHPTLAGSFNLSGTGSGPKITICGGPGRSIQVNSINSGSMSWNGNPAIDLTHAGPKDPGNCTTGTGADFGDFGGPSSGKAVLTNNGALGSTEHFVQPASPILDPLASVSPPSVPTITSSSSGVSLAAGSNGCPTGSGGCTLYFPGEYTSDIKVKNQTAVFAPGIYYMYGANLLDQANGMMVMATGLTDNNSTGTQSVSNCCGTGTSWTGNVMFYFTGPSGANGDQTGSISVAANAQSGLLVGSPTSSAYEGILFFADRNAAAQTYTLDGGGGLTLTGTIYLTNSLSVMQSHPSQYQTLSLQGNPGSSTHITGEIIASALTMGGTPGVVMDLNPNAVTPVRQVALVQ